MTWGSETTNSQYVRDSVNALEASAESAIRDLLTAAMSRYYPAITQTGFDNNPTWTLPDGREVDLAGLGDLPVDRPTLDIPPFVFNPEDYLNDEMLEKYSYKSEFYDDFLEDKLIDFINAESYFITKEVQDALFNETHERDLQILSDMTDQVDRQMTGKRGFPLPISMKNAAINELIKKYGDTRDSRNSEITALIAERAHDGVKHSISEGNKMESVRSQFQLAFGKLYWDAARYIIDKWEAEIRANIAEFNGEIDLIKAKTGTDKAMADYDLDYTKMDQEQQLARLKGHIDEMNGNIDTWKQSTAMQIRAAEDAVNYYKSQTIASLGVLNDIGSEDYTGTTTP